MRGELLVEICVDSLASAMAAERGGAARLELCSDLPGGGITPSAGMIERVRAKASLAIQVMIRPRSGDFCYDEDEFEVMRRDIAMAKSLGAQGVVFGILDADGNVDIERSSRLVELARPLEATFHRAFDMSADLFRSLEDVCATGADRILTSGGQPTALRGLGVVADLVKAAKGRIVIMAGSGIRADNARHIVTKSGVREIHAGLSSTVAGPMRFRHPQLSIGKAAEREYRRTVVLEENVRRLCEAVAGDHSPARD